MKRIISLLLAICMMASLTVVAFAEETTETIYASGHIQAVELGTYDAVTGHQVTYDSDSSSAGVDAVANGGTRLCKWVIFKFNIGEWDSISAANLTVRAYVDNSSAAVYAYKATPNDWNKAYAAAVTNGTDGVGTLGADNLLTAPTASTDNPRKTLTSKTWTDAEIAAANNASKAQFASILAYLTNPANIDADGNVYLGVSVYRSTNATGKVYNSNSADYKPYLTITGTRATGGSDVTFANATSSVAVADNTATVTTTATTGTAKLIAASYNGDEMADVIVRTVDAANTSSLSVDISALTAGTKTKVFLWADDMITPLADAAL